MLLKVLIHFFVIFWCSQVVVSIALSSENEKICDVKNENQQIRITIDTKFKEQIIQLREHLSEVMKTEFALIQQKLATQDEKIVGLQEKLTQQDNKVTRLIGIVNTQTEKLNHLSQNINQQKTEVENSMKVELQTQTQKYQEYIKTQLDSICGQGFLEQNQNLNEYTTINKLNQEKLFKEVASQPPKFNPNQWDSNFNCTNSCGPIMDLPSSCEEAMSSKFSKVGVHLLKIENSELRPFYGYCKRINNKVWTIIQRREDGSVDFYRNWTEYRNGFGNLYGEFWLGLERLHSMTKQHKYELHIWMMHKNGNEAYAHYDKFLIGSEAEKYKLTVDVYQGNSGNELSGFSGSHNGMNFSTYDNCNDAHPSGNECCAITYKGGWWFNNCLRCHLNGPYFSNNNRGIDWIDFGRKLKYTQMAIRRV